jgi:cytochrome c
MSRRLHKGVSVRARSGFYSDPFITRLRRLSLNCGMMIFVCCSAMLLASGLSLAQAPVQEGATTAMPQGDAARGRLVFGPCRTCHYFEPSVGHNFGPSLHRIFGRVAGKQEGFAYYSEDFKAAQFVWTPQLMYAWLENPMAMFPGSTMMSLGVPDAQQRADLIEFLKQATVRDP